MDSLSDSPTPTEKAVSSDTCQVFICYRQDDGSELAAWLFHLLNEMPLPTSGDELQPKKMSLYLDRAAPARGDWRNLYQASLGTAQALIVICTPGAYARLGKDDFVHREIELWIKDNKESPPILIIPGNRKWIPQSIAKTWFHAHTINFDLQGYKALDEEGKTREKQRVFRQISEAIAPAAATAVEKRFERIKRQNRKIRRVSWGLAFALVVAVIAGSIAFERQQAAQTAQLNSEYNARTANRARERAERSQDQANQLLVSQNWQLSQLARGEPFKISEVSTINATLYLLQTAKAARAAHDEKGCRDALFAASWEGARLVNTLASDEEDLSVTNSPNLQLIVTSIFDRKESRTKVQVWSAANGKPASPEIMQEGRTTAVFSPDGTRLLTKSTTTNEVTNLQQWDPLTAQPLGTGIIYSNSVRGLTYDPGGQLLLFWGGNWAFLWDLQKGEQRGDPLTLQHDFQTASFTKDGTRIVGRSKYFGAEGTGDAGIWDASSASQIGDIITHEGQLSEALLSNNGGRLATWGVDSATRAKCEFCLWNTMDGKRIGQPIPCPGRALWVAFSPDSRLLLCEREIPSMNYVTTYEFLLLNATNGTTVCDPIRLQGHGSGAAFSPDSQMIAIWCGEVRGELTLWSTKDGKPIGKPMGNPHGFTGAAFSPDSRYIVSWLEGRPHGGQLQLWDAKNGHPLASMPDANDVGGASFSGDGALIVSWSSRFLTRGDVRLYEKSGQLIGTPIPAGGSISLNRHLALLSDNQRLLVWNDGLQSEARIWNVSVGRRLGKEINVGGIQGALASPDLRFLTTWGNPLSPKPRNGEVQLWDLRSGNSIGLPVQIEGYARRAIFSPNSRFIAGWGNRDVHILDGLTFREIDSIKQFDCDGLAFSPDSKKLLAWGTDLKTNIHELQLWNVNSGSGKDYLPSDGLVRGAAFSTNGERILTWGGDWLNSHNVLQLWDGRDGASLSTNLSHSSVIEGAVFIHNGRQIVSWSGVANDPKYEIRIFDANERLKPIGEPILPEGPVVGSVSPDETKVMTQISGVGQIWNIHEKRKLGKSLEGKYGIDGAVFNHDSSRLVTWGNPFEGPGESQLWEVTTGKPIGPPLKHDGKVVGAHFNATGDWILTWSDDGTARLWGAGNGMCLAVLPHHYGIALAEFAFDDQSVITAGTDGIVRLWDISMKKVDSVENMISEFKVRSRVRLTDSGQFKPLTLKE